MQVRNIMTENPVTCTPQAKLRDVARLMIDNDCGAIPVVDGPTGGRLVGIVTDRDIVCRVIAQGKDPFRATVSDCMSSPVVTASADESVEDCCQKMESRQLRRIPVTQDDACCGIVSQADIARSAPEHEVAEVVKDISLPKRPVPAGRL